MVSSNSKLSAVTLTLLQTFQLRNIPHNHQRSQDNMKYVRIASVILLYLYLHQQLVDNLIMKLTIEDLQYIGKQYKKKATKGPNVQCIKDSLRIQDRSLLEMSDGGTNLSTRSKNNTLSIGHCLSLHQPWASLLVSGIKQ